jgi:hypothetical protein
MRTMKTAIAAGLGLCLVQAASAGYIDTTNNREWRQLTDTTGISVSAIAARCDAITGACSGSATAAAGGATASLDGWIWGSTSDLRSLFGTRPTINSTVDRTTWLSYGVTKYSEFYSDVVGGTWIDTDGVGSDTGAFNATRSTGDTNAYFQGYTRDRLSVSPGNPAVVAESRFIRYNNGAALINLFESIITVDSITKANVTDPTVGFWLFRDLAVAPPPAPVPNPPVVTPPVVTPPVVVAPPPAVVPLPSSLGLLAFGLLGLLRAKRATAST